MQTALLQIQTDITGRLAVELAAWGITVRSQRTMIISNELDEDQLVMTLCNGKSGAGCLVQMPTFIGQNPNVPGPIGYMEVKITAVEAPELNMNASSGTRRSAEEIAGRVAELLHLYAVSNLGTLNGGGVSKTTAQPGCIAYDVAIRLAYGFDVLAKTQSPSIAGTAAAITITMPEGTACYTIDGESFPGSEQPNSYNYAAPFAVESGSLIRCVSYLSGHVGSNLVEYTVP
jgi:hypothetical protein